MTTPHRYLSFKSICRLVSLITLLVGSFFYAYVQYGLAQESRAEVQTPYVITFQEIHTDAQGKKTTDAIIVAELKPEGGWVSKRYSAHSAHWKQSTLTERGLDIETSRGNQRRLEGVAPSAKLRKQMSTVEFYLNHPNYSGEGVLLGYRVFTLKSYLPDGTWEEHTFAPEIGAFRLRGLVHNPDGSTILQEAIRIEKK